MRETVSYVYSFDFEMPFTNKQRKQLEKQLKAAAIEVANGHIKLLFATIRDDRFNDEYDFE